MNDRIEIPRRNPRCCEKHHWQNAFPGDNRCPYCAIVYRGRAIHIEAAGHPQCQNFYIDNEPRGYVIFPDSAINAAKKIVDSDAGITSAR